LSGGNQQKVALARMLYHGVDVFLLDEPTKGIDVGSKEQIYSLIDAVAKEGKSVLMISSYLPELLGTCDRISVMRKGILSDPIPVDEANQENLMQLAVGN
jgi:ribose transport system ATP-binding protein